MKQELEEIRLSHTILRLEIDKLHTSEIQTREDMQRLWNENEKKDKQSLLLQLDVKHLRNLETQVQKLKSQSNLA